MPPSDLEINRTAHLWILQHGDDATAKAREMVEKMRRRGDVEGGHVVNQFIAFQVILAPGRFVNYSGDAYSGQFNEIAYAPL